MTLDEVWVSSNSIGIDFLRLSKGQPISHALFCEMAYSSYLIGLIFDSNTPLVASAETLIIQDEFTVVGNLSKKYVIKRNGASSPHSGYVFKDSGCMFLFSTGTNYPHEKLITPFLAFTYKNFNGNFSAAKIGRAHV